MIPFSLIANASRASRHASSAAAAARGVDLNRGTIGVQRRRGCRQRVAVHGLDRSDSLQQEVDPRSPGFALLALFDAAAQALRVLRFVAEPLHLLVERGELVALAFGDRRCGGLDCRVELLRELERGRAVAVDSCGRGGERGTEVAATVRRARGARASWPPASLAIVVAASAATPSRSSAATTVASASGTKSMRWQRDRIVGNKSSAIDVTRTTTVRAGGSSSVFNIAFADSFWFPRSRSASNRISTLRSPSIGARAASGRMRFRTSASTRYDAPLGSNSTTSGCTPRATRLRPRSSSPAPMSNVANARAASSTPDPRGPTSRYACTGRSAARSSVAMRAVLADNVCEHRRRD